jgi:uncharacterized membrane protein
MKRIFFTLSEYYLVILILLSGYTPPFSFNPISIGVAAIIILQIVIKNKIIGLVLGTLFLVANLFFLGALISEFNEFTAFNYHAKQLLFGGLSIWIINISVSIALIYKNIFDHASTKQLT